MSSKKQKRMVTVTYTPPLKDRGEYFPKGEYAIYSIESSATPQSICRKAFRRWIQMNIIKRQPRTISGGFEGVEVETQ